MSKKENFKNFVKQNPNLIKYVKDDSMTWQKFFEIYELYDEDESVWNEYLKTDNKDIKKENKSNNTFSDIMKQIKNIDADKFQNGITSLQKTLSLVGDLFVGKNSTTKTSDYKPRPVYRNFED